MPKKLIYRLLPTYLVITIVAIVALYWLMVRMVDDFYYRGKTKELRSLALLAGEITPESMLFQTDELSILCERMGQLMETRITIIASNGRVLGDSEEDPGIMDNHATRPEVYDAMHEGVGIAERYSFTRKMDMLYLALPVTIGNTPLIIRSSLPVTFLQKTVNRVRWKALWGGFIIILTVAAVNIGVYRQIGNPIVKMIEGAERFAGGDFSHRLAVPKTAELGGLADSLNRMAGMLDDRIRTILNQRNEREAVLASMVEGVLAVDMRERILSLNHAAAELFHTDPRLAPGKPVHDVLRNTDLIRFIRRVLSENTRVEKELTYYDSSEKFLKLQGTILKNAAGNQIGALIVFDDITHLKRLENMRRDFVANVSHELKTPITSIKGSADTLIESDLSLSEDAKRFIGIILRQSDRLNAIVNDLLALSRIEQQEEKGSIHLETIPLKPVVDLAVRDCLLQADQKNIQLSIVADETMSACINSGLIRQAVVNLIDNGVKYSDEGTEVIIAIEAKGSEILMSVRDHGCGIDDVHLPRLFERFYRVDKGRGRKQGGTGLGLSIVKHIAAVHRGSVSVESRVGAGSTFTIHLPG